MTTRTILMVDDEPAVLFGYARYFAQAGYQTVEAGTLAEARQTVRTRRFDAVLLDLNLPDGNGLEWIRELRTERPEGPSEGSTPKPPQPEAAPVG